jgi:Fic family protein
MTARVEGLWSALRDHVIEVFPPAPGRPEDAGQYLKHVDDIYRSDAYHSLAIEGYSVTPELVERARSGDWDPEHRTEDRNERDALAARGYWQAFQRVKESVATVLGGANAGEVARDAHREWYRELFQPFVAAGVLEAAALAGYRNAPVYIGDSRHVPPRAEAVREAMPTLFDLLEHEEDPSARAVLGHWLVGYIHPYPDGNGRVARFLMNVMLAAGGYPWTVVRVEDRDAYLAALEAASVESDVRPFADFLAERVRWSMEKTRA